MSPDNRRWAIVCGDDMRGANLFQDKFAKQKKALDTFRERTSAPIVTHSEHAHKSTTSSHV
jgi:hypothetical protein